MIDEVGGSSLFIGNVNLVAGDFEYFGEKVYLDEVDEDEISDVEDELEAEDGIEFEMQFYFLFEEQTMEFFQRLNDPRPSSRQKYMFCSLYLAMNGCSLFLILVVTSKASLNCSRGKESFIANDKLQ